MGIRMKKILIIMGVFLFNLLIVPNIYSQEEQISDLIEKVDSIQTDEVLLQKLEYWKEKAHSEIKRVENLEKQIVAHVDALTMAKIFV